MVKVTCKSPTGLRVIPERKTINGVISENVWHKGYKWRVSRWMLLRN